MQSQPAPEGSWMTRTDAVTVHSPALFPITSHFHPRPLLALSRAGRQIELQCSYH